MAEDGWDLTGIPPWVWPYVRTGSEAGTAVSLFASVVSLQLVGARIGGEIGQSLQSAAGSIVDDWEDDWCGTKPHPRPHPWQVLETAAHFAAFANQLPERSELRAGLLEIAGSLASKAFGPSVQAPDRVTV